MQYFKDKRQLEQSPAARQQQIPPGKRKTFVRAFFVREMISDVKFEFSPIKSKWRWKEGEELKKMNENEWERWEKRKALCEKCFHRAKHINKWN